MQKGAAATEAWTEARKRTTPAGLGGMVYAKLLKCGGMGVNCGSEGGMEGMHKGEGWLCLPVLTSAYCICPFWSAYSSRRCCALRYATGGTSATDFAENLSIYRAEHPEST